MMLLIGGVLLLALLLIGVMVRLAMPGVGAGAGRAESARQPFSVNVPTTPLPVVEPLELRALPPDVARQTNAAIPFVTTLPVAAQPFHLAGAPIDIERATDCLASAAYYEAGDDPVGERAVVQVVLNRARHPAFPSSICGVVFQGQERKTGCQFTFTCDGAMVRRKPSAGAWGRARTLALASLNGSVFAAVGLATHYHTDWVVPYWSARLDKIAMVGTHLFFRWPGGWGQPRAFAQRPSGEEPAIARLASLSPAHGEAALGLPLAPLAQRLEASGRSEEARHLIAELLQAQAVLQSWKALNPGDPALK